MAGPQVAVLMAATTGGSLNKVLEGCGAHLQFVNFSGSARCAGEEVATGSATAFPPDELLLSRYSAVILSSELEGTFAAADAQLLGLR